MPAIGQLQCLFFRFGWNRRKIFALRAKKVFKKIALRAKKVSKNFALRAKKSLNFFSRPSGENSMMEITIIGLRGSVILARAARFLGNSDDSIWFFAILKCSENHSINQRSLGKNHKSTEKTPVWEKSILFEKKTPVWKKNSRLGKKTPVSENFSEALKQEEKNFLPFQNRKNKHCALINFHTFSRFCLTISLKKFRLRRAAGGAY